MVAISAGRTLRRATKISAALLLASVLLTGCITKVGGSGTTQEVISKNDIQLVTVIQTSTNPYMLQWADGSQAFADSVGLPLKTIVANGDSQQQLSQIQATIAAGKKVVLTINPINSADVPAIVKAVTRSGGYLTTQWNKPADYVPQAIGPNYVAHLTYDGYSAGYWTGKKLFEAMGGQGGVVAFKGQLDSPPSQQRYAGMEKALAEFPGITLLDTQAAGWDRQTAFDQTQSLITKHGSELQGVWAASDSMTLGALAALEQAGKASSVKVSGNDGTGEALERIDAGDTFVDTYTSDGYYNGALGLAMAYEAALGELDVATLTQEQRSGNYAQFGIDKSNVADYLTRPADDAIIAEVNKGLFARLVGPELP